MWQCIVLPPAITFFSPVLESSHGRLGGGSNGVSKPCQCNHHTNQQFFTVTCFLRLWSEILGIKSCRTSLFPPWWRMEGIWGRQIPENVPLNHTCPILLSGYCSMRVLPAHLKLWTAKYYNLLINKKSLCYSSVTSAHLIWNGSNVVINLSRVYFKVADMFSNDRPGIYFLSLICIYLQLI